MAKDVFFIFFSLNVLALSAGYDKYNALLGYGVIGNTPVFGTGILGSSPSSPTTLSLLWYNNVSENQSKCVYTCFCFFWLLFFLIWWI